MKGSLPILTLLVTLGLISVAMAQGSPRESASSEPLAAEKLERAIAAIESYQSVTAKLRQRIDLFDQQLVGSGTYLQGPAADHTFRLELRIQVGDRVSSLQHVSDGKTLWTYRQFFDEGKLTKVDLRRVIAALSKQAGVTPGVGGTQWLGLGGLPKLLRSLDEHFEFEELTEHRLGELPVWRLRGGWKTKHLAVLLPDQKTALEAGQPANLKKLRAELPDEVVLYLGRDDLFPYRIDYCRRSDGLASATLGEASSKRTLLTLEIFEVGLNVPLDASRFVYQPGATPVPDATGDYLLSLGLQRKPAE